MSKSMKEFLSILCKALNKITSIKQRLLQSERNLSVDTWPFLCTKPRKVMFTFLWFSSILLRGLDKDDQSTLIIFSVTIHVFLFRYPVISKNSSSQSDIYLLDIFIFIRLVFTCWNCCSNFSTIWRNTYIILFYVSILYNYWI